MNILFQLSTANPLFGLLTLSLILETVSEKLEIPAEQLVPIM
ncbi:hypothetical protein N8289_03070 [Flavobacteriales bacterium]|jgi:hypothetical protein|nr:hypothetical protein [Flavobacteriales bacterium]MDB9932410.1 hypothetical protein [Flavobacteriales bacterium]MDC1370803.1 hypothetical protein [Flavobacteriales bacterium]MDG1176076.1 hypothetical protein [Flavobacteriales bacterium]